MRVCEHTPFRIGWNQDVACPRMRGCHLARHTTPGNMPRKPEHPTKEIKQTNKQNASRKELSNRLPYLGQRQVI